MTLDPDVALAAALEYVRHNWEIFPLRGKVPAIPNPHPRGSVERQTCKGECGLQGHGVLDATLDAVIVTDWWGGRYAGFNIGLRVPDAMIVIDVDPRHGGDKTLAELEAKFGPLPETLTTISGRGDGGRHMFFRRPPGKLSGARLGPGLDLKTSAGYVVGPPSRHPDSGGPYVRIERPVAAPTPWLVTLVRKDPPAAASPRPRPVSSQFFFSGSIADEYSANSSWADILAPHGWRCIDADPDADGARWLHPTHTSACSATVRNGCLFVWSTSTVFDISEPGFPKGYTRFRAYALLNHDGDLSAAACALRGVA